jgi:hypothetical protein
MSVVVQVVMLCDLDFWKQNIVFFLKFDPEDEDILLSRKVGIHLHDVKDRRPQSEVKFSEVQL